MFYWPVLKGVKVHDFHKSRDNRLNPLEIQLQQELLALDRPDLAGAVGGSRKYQRLREVMAGSLLSFESMAGLLLAFHPYTPIPRSKEEWIARGKVRFASDEAFQAVIAAYDELVADEARGSSSNERLAASESAEEKVVEMGSAGSSDAALLKVEERMKVWRALRPLRMPSILQNLCR
jgi:hypothetical protein